MAGETLFEMRGRVKELKVNASKESIEGAINRAIRLAVDGRRWADLLRLGGIAVPAPYSTGTVSTTQGSRIVTGTGTSWPLADTVNTIFAAVSYDIGYTEMAPASMDGIQQGTFLLLDEGTGSQEIVTVSATTPASFFCQARYAHAVGASIWSSSFAGQQFRLQNTVSTVRAVYTPTSQELDMPWASIPVVDGTYRIYQGYVTVSPTARRLLDAWDPVAGQRLGVNKTLDWLNRWDPQRTSSGNPQELVSLPPSMGGVMQWAVWPTPSAQRGIDVLYQDGWPKLVADNDISPPFMSSEIFIASAAADVLLTKVIAREGRQDPFYDPTAASYWRSQADQTLEVATQADEGRYMQSLKRYNQMLTGGLGDWQRSHAVYADSVGWGSPYGF